MAEATESESVSGTGSHYEERTPLSAILTYTSPAPCIGFMFFLVSMYLM